MKTFVIDIKKCTGCYNCQIVCKDEHVGNDWSPFAKPQPDTGQFWMRMTEKLRGTIPKVKMAYLPIPCQHCQNAPCIASCPVQAIYTRPDGLVIIDPAKCIGCKRCIGACPYDAIFYNDDLALAQKCTGCAHLIDRGWPIKEPRCSDACPFGSITFGDDSALASQISSSETLHPEFKLQTRVHYLNLPKKFIGGTVYDPANNEVVIGATCTLSGSGTATATTDGFGDFWFEGLAVGTYSVDIAAAGKTKTIPSISTAADVNLGDIQLQGGSANNPKRTYTEPTPTAPTTTTGPTILSPDGNFKLSNIRLEKTGAEMNKPIIMGTITNLSSAAHNAMITIDFIGDAGKVLGTKSETGTLTNIPAGGSRAWSIQPDASYVPTFDSLKSWNVKVETV